MWKIVTIARFDQWFLTLPAAEQESILVGIFKFAFDPARQAVMLCGGDKTGNKQFYPRMIAIAEQEFTAYLAIQEYL